MHAIAVRDGRLVMTECSFDAERPRNGADPANHDRLVGWLARLATRRTEHGLSELPDLDQGIALGKITGSQQTFGAVIRVLGDFNMGGEDRVAGEIMDHVIRLEIASLRSQ